jgi:hypothetical protein
MKLDKNPFPVNMSMVELDEKKVLVQPSQTESINGKDVVKAKKSERWSMTEK